MFDEVKDSEYSFQKVYDTPLMKQLFIEHLVDSKNTEISEFLKSVESVQAILNIAKKFI